MLGVVQEQRVAALGEIQYSEGPQWVKFLSHQLATWPWASRLTLLSIISTHWVAITMECHMVHKGPAHDRPWTWWWMVLLPLNFSALREFHLFAN